MRKYLFLLFIFLLLSACGRSAPLPGWQENGYRQLENYKTYFLSGREDSSEPHFLKALREIAAGNDMNLLSLAYLTKYGLHAAALESFDTADFARLYRQAPIPANMAYCHFLKGNFTAVDPSLLSARYAGVLKVALAKDPVRAARELAAIDDPLSRLIACGVWVRYRPYDEHILQIALAAASDNGWKRPLWAYLDRLQNYYEAKGDTAQAGMIRDRLLLLKKMN
jgi:hypothetical protein